MKLNRYLLTNKFKDHMKIVVMSPYESSSWSFNSYWDMLDDSLYHEVLAQRNVICCTKCADNYGKPGYLIYVM